MTSKMAASTKISSVFRPSLFKDKVAIVTGGGTGIGKAITQELLFLGCNVMIASRNIERLAHSADQIRNDIKPYNSRVRLEHMQCNIRNEEQVQNLISTTLTKFGKLDFLVNNGGGQFPSPAADIRLKGWNAVIETNLTGTFLCCREAYKQWFEEHGGVIVNIIADMWKGFPMMSHTGAARAAVDNLTKSLAIEWADKGVRVNSVAPGSSIYSETAAANYGSADIFNSYIPKVPAQRLGRVEEVSSCVCYLLSPAASFISGETVKVDAGASLYSTMWTIPDHSKLPAYSWDNDSSVAAADDDNDDSSGSGTKSKL
ncbi:peroxisomal trans-2-enoyl-CoA reductase-like [Dreissena polymorpha]|uniref:peroxisomal trans-2-enoyl-CoA reductase-like n=1 Tax=Dreissena polymorpha TaxID=45954 RepID=UPI002264A948|nr:peroxisomal trans-2-enoyl-CoA reductase-like [Dreissena polymorpha]